MCFRIFSFLISPTWFSASPGGGLASFERVGVLSCTSSLERELVDSEPSKMMLRLRQLPRASGCGDEGGTRRGSSRALVSEMGVASKFGSKWLDDGLASCAVPTRI